MSRRLRSNSVFVDREANKGDFVTELKQQMKNFKPKSVIVRPKKMPKVKLQNIKLKPVSARTLPPTPPKQQNLFQKLVADGIAQRKKKAEGTQRQLKDSKVEEAIVNDNPFEKSDSINNILGATDVNGRLQFFVEWNCAEGFARGLVDAPIVNEKFPQEVIGFYQNHARFEM